MQQGSDVIEWLLVEDRMGRRGGRGEGRREWRARDGRGGERDHVVLVYILTRYMGWVGGRTRERRRGVAEVLAFCMRMAASTSVSRDRRLSAVERI